MGTLRTDELEKTYAAYRNRGELENDCKLCGKPPRQTFQHWKIVQNDFPYDKIASVHHMIVPLRHMSESELSPEETEELRELKSSYLNEHYEFIIEPVQRKKTIPNHFHLHLIVAKD
ncbi:MAG: hypothetical protein HYY10_03880 [Candidatus Liptonbacteria bacterium]|nr:hypothetical protein [Candidatus Liptonbacteria bacterium]